MMLDKIIDSPNKKALAIERLRKEKKPIILYGAGSYAVDVARFLENYEIPISTVCVDEAYVKQGQLFGESIPVVSVADALAACPDGTVVIGFNDYKKAKASLQEHEGVGGPVVIDAPNHLEFFNKAYIAEHEADFQKTYDMLADEKSREIFIAFINAKISGDPSGLYDFAEFNQYFNPITNLGQHETFVDCGAYDGDTVRSFLAYTKNAYDKIFAFEPDPTNLTKLESFIAEAGLKNIVVVKKGAWSESTELHFTAEGNISTIVKPEDAGNNSVAIPVDSIDSIVGDTKVTFIKMDIEGAEMPALEGAKMTIKRDQPKLAICAYHLPDDLIKIPSFIAVLGDYDYYLRHHQYISWEMVLYAIPKPV